MDSYELKPITGQKSFYKKAIVYVIDDVEYLVSYYTIVISRDMCGRLHRHWRDWSATTGRHIKSFCGLCKKDYTALSVESVPERIDDAIQVSQILS